MTCGIPKKLAHIWIGPQPAPVEWMKTWKHLYPDWKYTLYDNNYLRSHTFRTKNQIKEYLKRRQYAGVADLMRLEILYEQGGFMPEADSICLRKMAHLFKDACAYTIYENEMIRGKLVSPIQACEPGNEFVGELIDSLSKLDPDRLEEPWISTGNFFTATMISKMSPNIVIFPSHYMIPIHYSSICYEGDDVTYAIQKFGSTSGGYSRDGYRKQSIIVRVLDLFRKRMARRYHAKMTQLAQQKRIEAITNKISEFK